MRLVTAVESCVPVGIHPDSKGHRSVALVESHGEVGGKTFVEWRYFFLGLASNSGNIAGLNEDGCRVRRDHLIKNLSLLRKVALNLTKGYSHSSKNRLPMRRKRTGGGWNRTFLLELLHGLRF